MSFRGKGGSGGKGKGGGQAIQNLEQQLSEQANSIYEGILDLNVTMAKLTNDWKKLMTLRSKILTMYGVPPEQAAVPMALAAMPDHGRPERSGKGERGGRSGRDRDARGKGERNAKGPPVSATIAAQVQAAVLQYMSGNADHWGSGGSEGGAGAGAGAGQALDHKSKLNMIIAQKAKRPLTKGELEYKVIEAEGGGYRASVSSTTVLRQEYWAELTYKSKREAEHAAARVALAAEHPEALAGESEGGSGGAAAGRGSKRKADQLIAPGSRLPEDPKGQLARAAQLLLGRSCSKTDVLYNTTTIEGPGGSQYIASVQIPEYDGNVSHEGAPADTIKQAEANAATVAVAALSPVFLPLEEERLAKKAQKTKENLEKLKLRKEAREGQAGPA